MSQGEQIETALQQVDLATDLGITARAIRLSTYVDSLDQEGWKITLVLDPGDADAWEYEHLSRAKRAIIAATDRLIADHGAQLPGLTLADVEMWKGHPDPTDADGGEECLVEGEGIAHTRSAGADGRI